MDDSLSTGERPPTHMREAYQNVARARKDYESSQVAGGMCRSRRNRAYEVILEPGCGPVLALLQHYRGGERSADARLRFTAGRTRVQAATVL